MLCFVWVICRLRRRVLLLYLGFWVPIMNNARTFANNFLLTKYVVCSAIGHP